jgi:Cys-tRNA(Pro)/Cys-tRNA(Cys) deacylase
MGAPRKTNAMRILESLGIRFEVATHDVPAEPGDSERHLEATQVAGLLGVSPDILFKTLVARTGTGEVVVLCIPGSRELDLKKAARAVRARRIELLPLRELTPLTGYVRGGCSPVGMKKSYRTWIDGSASRLARMYVNGGARGLQVILPPADLLRAVRASYADLV